MRSPCTTRRRHGARRGTRAWRAGGALIVALALALGMRAMPALAQCADADADGVCDDVDNCPALANPDQADLDGDSGTCATRATPS